MVLKSVRAVSETYKIGIGTKFHRFNFVFAFCPNGTKKCPSDVGICPQAKISLFPLQLRIFVRVVLKTVRVTSKYVRVMSRDVISSGDDVITRMTTCDVIILVRRRFDPMMMSSYR